MAWLSGLLLIFLAQNSIACKDGEVQFILATYSTCQGGQFAFTGCTQMLNNGTNVQIPIGQAIQEPGNKKFSCFVPPEIKGVPLANEIACTDDDNNLIQPGEKKVLPDGTILTCTQISQYTLRREIFTPGKSPTSSIVDNVYFAVDSKGNKVEKGCAPYNNETTISVGESAVLRGVHYSCSSDNGQIVFKPDSCISQDGKKMEISAKQQLADGSSESCVADGVKVVYFAAIKNGCRLNNGKYVRINAIHQEEKALLEDGKPFKYYVNYRCTQNSAIFALTPVGCDVGQEGSIAYGEMVTIGQKTYSCELTKTDEVYVESINAQDASCKVGGKTYLHGEELFDSLNTTIYRCDKGNLIKTGCWAKGKRFIIGETFYCADHGYYCPVAGTGPVYLGEGCQVDGKLIHFKKPYTFTDGQYVCNYKITEIGVRPYWAPQACAYKNGLLDLGSYSFDNLSNKYYFCGFSYKNRTLYVRELTTEESDCAKAAGGFSSRCVALELPPKRVKITVPTEETPKGQPLIPGIQEEITKTPLGNAEGTTKTPVGPNGPSPSGSEAPTDSPNSPPGPGGFTGPTNLPGATTESPSGLSGSPNGSNPPGGSTVSSNGPNSSGSPNRSASPGPNGPVTSNVPGSPIGSPNGVPIKSPAGPTGPNQTSGPGGITSLPNQPGVSTGSPDGLNPPGPNGAQTGLPNASGATTKSPNGPASGPGVSTVSSNRSNGLPGASTTVSSNVPNPPGPNGPTGSPNAPGASTVSQNDPNGAQTGLPNVPGAIIKSPNGPGAPTGSPSGPGSPIGSPNGVLTKSPAGLTGPNQTSGPGGIASLPNASGATTKSPSFISGSPSGQSSSGPGVPTASSNGPNLPGVSTGSPTGSPNGPGAPIGPSNASNSPGVPTKIPSEPAPGSTVSSNGPNGPATPNGLPNGTTNPPNGPGASTVSQNDPNGAQTGLPNVPGATTKSPNEPGVPTGSPSGLGSPIGSPNGVPIKSSAGPTGPNQTSGPGGLTNFPNQPGVSTGSPDEPGASTKSPNGAGASTVSQNGPNGAQTDLPNVSEANTKSPNGPGSPTSSPGSNGSGTGTPNGPNPPGPGAPTGSSNGSNPPGVPTKTPIRESTVSSNGLNPPGSNGPGTPGVSTKSPNVSGPSILGSNTGSPDGYHPPAEPTSSPNGPTNKSIPGEPTVPGKPVPTKLLEKEIIIGKPGPTPPAGGFTVKPVSPSANNGGTTKSPQTGDVTGNGPTKSPNAPGGLTDSPSGATGSSNVPTAKPRIPTAFTLGAAARTAAMTPKPGPTLAPKTPECCIFENDKLCNDVCKMLAPHCAETMLAGIKKALPPNSDSIYMLLKYFNRNAQATASSLSNLAKMFNITSLSSHQLSLRISNYIQIITRDRIAESADCQLYLSSCIHGNIDNCNKLSSPECQISYKCPNLAPGCLQCQNSRSSRVDMQHLVEYLCPGTCFVKDNYLSAAYLEALTTTTSTTTTITTTTTTPHCATGWTLYNGNCYIFASTLALQPAAIMGCQTMDPSSTLASMHSAADNTFLKNLSGSKGVWIGLYSTVPNVKSFAYLDGTPFDYTNWAPGNPDNPGRMEDCISIARTFAASIEEENSHVPPQSATFSYLWHRSGHISSSPIVCGGERWF